MNYYCKNKDNISKLPSIKSDTHHILPSVKWLNSAFDALSNRKTALCNTYTSELLPVYCSNQYFPLYSAPIHNQHIIQKQDGIFGRFVPWQKCSDLLFYNHKRSRPYNIDRVSETERVSSSRFWTGLLQGTAGDQPHSKKSVSLKRYEKKKSAQEGENSKETLSKNLRKRG